MCGRYSQVVNLGDIYEFAADGNILAGADILLQADVRPSMESLVIAPHKGKNYLTKMKWGWKRDWTKRLLINGRIEEASTKSLWKDALVKQRCIIPANGWWEWKEVDGKKTPYFHQPEGKGNIYFGAVYEKSDTGYDYVIMTHNAVEQVKHIHHRMPVVIEPHDLQNWFHNPEWSTDFASTVNSPSSSNLNWNITELDPYKL